MLIAVAAAAAAAEQNQLRLFFYCLLVSRLRGTKFMLDVNLGQTGIQGLKSAIKLLPSATQIRCKIKEEQENEHRNVVVVDDDDNVNYPKAAFVHHLQ